MKNMQKIVSYRELVVWQNSKDLAVRTYKLTNYLPPTTHHLSLTTYHTLSVLEIIVYSL